MSDIIRSGLDSLAETVAEVKPKLRGWLHLGTAPLTVAAGIVLIALSPTAPTRIGSAVYALSAVLLFTVSAVYHRGHWSPRVHGFLRRFDHANIFLLIAGSYTPFTLLLLEGTQRVVLLSVIWSVAVLGVLFKVFWIGAPKWLYIPIYVGMGWAAVFFIPAFADGSPPLRGRDRHGRARARHHRRGALHGGRRRLRHQATQPVARLVRLPRGVPHA